MEAILAAGASGLRYFEVFVPRAIAVAERFGHGDRFPALAEFRSRYFRERGIDVDVLDADIAVVAATAAELDRRLGDEEAAAGELAAAWTGAVADRVGEHLRNHLARADAVRRSAYDIRDALAAAARTLRDAVTAKAAWAGDLDTAAAGGLTPEEIDAALVSGDCDDRLTAQFLPHVRDTVARFTAVCDATDTTVDDAYRALACAFAQVDDSAFPVPAPLAAGCPAPRVGCPVPQGEIDCAPSASAAPASAATAGAVSAALDLGGERRPLPAPADTVPAPARPQSSLALDGVVLADAARAVGAVVGVTAQVALGIVDRIGDAVCDALETREPCADPDERDCSPNVQPEPVLAPQPEPEPEREPEPQPPCEPPAPEPADDCADPAPEAAPAPPAPAPPEPAPPEPAPAADYCVPASDSDATGSAPRMLGPRSAAGHGGAAEKPVLAEAGPAPAPPADPDPEPSAVLAEAGPL